MATYVAEDLNDPTLYFETLIWTGDGNTPRTLTGLDFAPNMIWSKRRDDAAGHNVLDSVRGAGANAELCPSSTGAEGSNAAETYGYLSAFTSDGFTVTAGSSDNAYWNNNTATYVAWCWKESATAGFDIVTYAGDAAEGRNISHSLGAVPHVMIVKNRSADVKWVVYHHKNTSAPETDHLQLSDDAATSDDDSTWDDTAPGSSVFRIKGSSSVNGSSANYVSYLFTEKQGFSKFGGYTGNGNADGTFVPLSFRPAWLLIKKTSATEDWGLIDNKRDPNNDGASSQLFPNGSNTEDSSNDRADLLSNGFKLKTSSGQWNTDGASYIYMAFAEAPFVNSKGVPANAR